MFKKLINIIKFKYYLWKEERLLKKEIDSTLLTNKTNFQLVQDSIKKSCSEGLLQVKKKINEQAQVEGHDKVLSKTDDIVKFAEYEDEQRKKIVETLKQAFVYTNEKPINAMVNDRISQYYELQRFNEERQLIKNIKKARKEGNDKLAEQLEGEWANKYKRRITTH